MISFVSSVCPAPNVEKDEDLISTFKKGKKQKRKLKKKNNMVKNVSPKFTYFLLLLKVGPFAWLKNNKLETRQTKNLFLLKSFGNFHSIESYFYHVLDRLPRADSTYSHEDIKINLVKPCYSEHKSNVYSSPLVLHYINLGSSVVLVNNSFERVVT